MTQRRGLLILSAGMTLHMIYLVIDTSLRSNLFREWSSLASIPWMVTTVKDFYQVLVPFWLWMLYKEGSAAGRMVWTILFVGLGSIATSAYMFWRLWQWPEGRPVADLLLRRTE